jgi:hypothetical protein
VEVAVIAVEVVQRAVDEVVDVVPVRDGGVAAAGVVPGRALDRGAGGRMAPVHVQDVLAHSRGDGRMQVPVVEIIGVISMANDPVTTSRPVLVQMLLPVLHGVSSSPNGSIVRVPSRGQAKPEGA